MKYREVAQKLRELGCVHVRNRGSHRIWENPKTGEGAPLPDWGGRDIKLGTLRAALRQLGIEWDDFQKA